MTSLELCSDGYFQTLGQHLLQGRLLTPGDITAAAKVAVVNASLARTYFAGQNPIGQQIKFNVLDKIPETPHDAYFEIVGIVNDARSYDVQGDTLIPRAPDKTLPEGFLPYSISGFGNRAIAMQTRVPPASLVNYVRQILWSLDHDVLLVQPNVAGASGFSLDKMMQGLVYGKQEFAAIAFGACAGLGFVLALLGLFNMMTYIVSLQNHDIGIRLALGASKATVLRVVLQRGMLLIVMGVSLGAVVTLGVTRFLSSQFRGISARDPLTLGPGHRRDNYRWVVRLYFAGTPCHQGRSHGDAAL